MPALLPVWQMGSKLAFWTNAPRVTKEGKRAQSRRKASAKRWACSRWVARSRGRYAWDLCGAALGCIAVIVGLLFIDPISIIFFLSAILSLMAVWAQKSKSSLGVRSTAGALVLLCLIQTASLFHHAPIFKLLWAKDPNVSGQEAPEYEAWNSYSLVSIWKTMYAPPFGWGYGVKPTYKVQQKYLSIDHMAGTIITRFDGNTKEISYLKNDIINLGYQLRDIGSVAVIGVGGGRDILSGLAFNARSILGLEINSSILHALNEVYGEFTGYLYKLPQITFANAEARSYLNSHPARYDLIQISLIDTWAATSSGGLALTENKLYTTDAWNDFLDRLNENGLLVISRWIPESDRLFSIASATLKARDPEANPRDHMMAATVNGVVTLIISRSAFTQCPAPL